MLKIGTMVKVRNGTEYPVVEVGERCGMAGGYAAPVKLGDGTYGIANVYDGNDPYPIGLWVPDYPDAAKAIASSVEIPAVRHGIGSDVVHVRGKDAMGEYLVKMFYNEKKMHYLRADEVYR